MHNQMINEKKLKINLRARLFYSRIRHKDIADDHHFGVNALPECMINVVHMGFTCTRARQNINTLFLQISQVIGIHLQKSLVHSRQFL